MTGNVVEGGIEAQVRQTFANLAAALAVHGAGLDGIVKLTVYVADRADYDAFKRVRAEVLAPPFPASTAVRGDAPDRRHAGRDRCGRGARRRAPAAVTEGYPTLLSPVRLGPATLRNRIVSTSHQTSLVHDGVPTDDFLAYQEARARGGAAAIFIEATAVHETGLLTSHSIAGFDPAVVPVYRRIGDALRAHGAALFLQLFHGGRERITAPPRPAAVAPSAVPSPRFHVEPRALTRRDIADLVAAFADCAAKARAGGVDGLEVSFSHGYLGAQFFSPMTNLRDDEYDLEHGLRFGREVLAAVREAAGDRVAVGVRLAADEGPTGALGPAACARIARGLCGDGLVDFVDLALGYSATLMGSVGIVPPPPVERNAIAEPAGAVRAVLPGLPMIATTRIVELADAERLLADGQADVIGMTRAMIADPDLGLEGRRRPGRRNAALHRLQPGLHGPLPRGRADRMRRQPADGPGADAAAAGAGSQRDVLVIGGARPGRRRPQGARNGDGSRCWNAADEIGGQLAARRPGARPRGDVGGVRRRRPARLAAAGVDVRLGTAATTADADGRELVVLATAPGRRAATPPRPAVPDRPGVGGDRRPRRDRRAGAGGRLGRRLRGPRRGRAARRGRARRRAGVRRRGAGEDIHQYQRNLYLARLDKAGVRIRHHLGAGPGRATAAPRLLRPGGADQPGRDGRPGPGPRARRRAVGGVEGRPGVVRAGDVLGPRSAEEAILEGTLAVR